METLANDLKKDVVSLFQAQREYQYIAKQSTAEERIKKLLQLKSTVLPLKDEIIEAAYTDSNKPPFETMAMEFAHFLEELDDACANLPEWMKRERVNPSLNPDAKAEIMYEPRGVVLIMGPWNMPFLLTVSPMIAALAAGNTAILKPSEFTPSVSAIIKQIISATFDEQEIAVVEGGVDITTELLKLPFDHIFLTGSPKVGKIVMEAAAKNLASVTMELGGKSPVIIDSGANLDKAVADIMKAKTFNAGQLCLACDYVLLPAALQESFIAKAKDYVQTAYYQNGSFNNGDYAQIINLANFNRLKHLFDDAVAKGAKVAMGGVFDLENRRIQPTILTDISTDMAIMAEEIFGPITPIINYNTKEEAVAYIRKFAKPLNFYAYSESPENIDYFLSNTTSGGVCINDLMQQTFDLRLPFGGVNNSGIGSYHGVYGFRELSNRRSVYYQSPQTPVDEFAQPPYAGKESLLWKQLTKNSN
jgi:aldehyde dehydrogenase (NAD+)